MSREVPEPPGAVLRPERARQAFEARRFAPAPELAEIVTHYWFLDWDLERRHVQSVLPLPCVNVVFEADGAAVHGVWTRRYDRVLEGRGGVVGVLFRPAGYRALAPDAVMAELVDRSVPLVGVVDPGATFAELRALSDEARVAWLDGWVRAAEPQWSPRLAEINALVDAAASRPELERAEQLAGEAGCSLRTLQRRMREVLGVGPKAVLRRFRLQEAAARLAEGAEVDQAELALRLGYYDQAHFVRDFRAAVGEPPGAYRKGMFPDLGGS